MAKPRTVFRCAECGGEAPRWAGRCPACGQWNSLVEERAVVPSSPSTRVGRRSVGDRPRPVPIDQVDAGAEQCWPTGVNEVDRVLGGGLVPGSVTLVGGEPGVGKSTLLLQLASELTARGRRVLYVTAEESASQVRARAERLGALRPRLWLGATTVLPHVLADVDDLDAEVVVVDSIQTVHDPELSSAPGSVAQVRECAHRLVGEAKARGTAVLLVGHVTKEGSLAGPRVLEHVVDTVLAFEGDRHHALRLLRAAKHRFGSTSELGVFEMTDSGLLGVPDASGLFLADRRSGLSGSIVVPTVDGHRPLLVEVQALVTPAAGGGSPRRSAQGVDAGRLAFLLAVLQAHAGLTVGASDVYALAVGGVRVVEPGADLGVALAVVSAERGRAIPGDVVACGEIGLGGELRQVGQTTRRLEEAARLGFCRAVIPLSAPSPPVGVEALRAATVADALELVGLDRGTTRRRAA
jgi:DNA repair protein RadA/Sms